jgi:hypothetical protein
MAEELGTGGLQSRLVRSWGGLIDMAMSALGVSCSSCSYGGLPIIAKSWDRVRDLWVRSAGAGEEPRAMLLAVCTKDARVAAGWP